MKDIFALSQKYKNSSIFQKFPRILSFQSKLEEMLSGIYLEEMPEYAFEINLLRDFLSKCLELNPQRRLTACQLLKHPVFQLIPQKLKSEIKQTDSNILTKMAG
eukprot:TRINITY_DN47723_c0_g1_i1.p2 TRINITY_DN47723_c0_g1~~TRINITY_DN47723_c0_g1_i1.p2  ORF type:complete len:104 (+),score=16.56 TRINITY_DN47723_c0_g1_i1:237-548(+)